MKKQKSIVLSALLAFGLMLSACATPPVEEMDRAHDAVIRAESDVNAVNYAANTLIRARDTLTRMQSEADARRFDAARDFAAEAVNLAERAIIEGRAGAVRARDEAASLLNNLSAPLAEITNAVNAAEQASTLDLDFNALAEDLDLARRSYNNARQSLALDNYGDAIALGQNARAILTEINGKLNEAVHLAARK
ncbi:MAG: DUF4398 domain-containing protein [Treponema sp.]|nr:DUF4398 domain-containing protein [Treponema sp.]